MSSPEEEPELLFFRTTPDRLMSRPPLCASLQNLESCFLMIALRRFPHALVTCASSIESAVKSFLNVPADDRRTAKDLATQALKSFPALQDFDLRAFRDKRNEIAHYGFTPRDDEEAATLLLSTGLPLVRACYQEFFNFDLWNGLLVEFGDQLKI